jgi:prepilin-type N-terminal cleavage/methylation domain-containing protein
MRPRQHGFTLIELTVVLAVIVTLALILTPSITNFINDSRVARARADTQTISAAILQFYRDTGYFPQWTAATGGGPGANSSRVDLLVGPGNAPLVPAPNTWTTGSTDQLANQLMANTPGYTARGATSASGWNGPYLSSTIDTDPWNNRYMVNVGLIDTSIGVQATSGTLKSAVWVISAGPNGTIDTLFTQPVTTAVLGGDDIGIRVQ